ncbi:MAG: GH92 family glycosyl hydrolase [Bacteroidales bacterium]|jgi:predicted alpha-1,2-mannosidase|nr:GH92 family glycosyl hydrolase [Bacteroidales bacterium]
MMKIQIYLFLFLLTGSFFVSCKEKIEHETDYTQFVNPFVGTDFHGHTFPGAIAPFGMIQVSPDSRLEGWDGCSAYHYSDSLIYGFSHTHLSGTGCSDYGDVLLMPFNSTPSVINTEYARPFSHDHENASPGYYSVLLNPAKPNDSINSDILVELTSSTRVALHRYTFEKGVGKKGVIIDLQHRDEVLASTIVFNKENNNIYGIRKSAAWNPHQQLAFSFLFSQPIEKVVFYKDNYTWNSPDKIEGLNCKAVLYFNDTVTSIVVKAAISANTSEENAALKNHEEVAGFDFDKVRNETNRLWNRELGKIEVFSPDVEKKKVFYTAMYHAFIAPNLFTDINGDYLGHDGKLHHTEGEDIYTVFSLWDTYRALHPLLNIIDQNRSKDFIYTFMKNYEQGGMLPVWELAGYETWCMIGYHSVPVIYDAYQKGFVTHNSEQLLKAMIHSAKLNKLGRPEYAKYGYIPGDMEHEDVSKTLEYAYDDWCITQFAKTIGNHSVYKSFAERAQYWKNIMDKNGFMHTVTNGAYINTFNPTEINNHITEGNSWQYSTYVPHDFNTWIDFIGGAQNANDFLDSLFYTSSNTTGRQQVDVTGLIGQYAHGNEPSHHAAYLYNYVGKAYKTQLMVRKIMKELYTSKPDGLCGNEDCGQMSAWYIFSAMGFYPVCPGDNQYIMGSPIFDRVIIHLENGKDFTVECKNQSDKNIYIKSANLNGRSYNKSFINYDDIKNGGTLKLLMSSTPNKYFGKNPKDRPVSKMKEEPIVINPTVTPSKMMFIDTVEVSLSVIHGAAVEIFYTLDGTLPSKLSKKYITPITLSSSCIVRSVAYNPNNGLYSKVTDSKFIKSNKDKKIEIKSHCSSMYTAGGADALIDNLRGKKHFSLGGWQGYQGEDFEAVVDLGKTKELTLLGAGFLQAIRSWIVFPTSVSFDISEDGVLYKNYGVYKNTFPVRNEEEIIQDFTVSKSDKARYIRIKAKNFGKLPEWHLGAGGEAFIFIDEILINTKEE